MTAAATRGLVVGLALVLAGALPVAADLSASYAVRGAAQPLARGVNGHVQQVVRGDDGGVVVTVTASWRPIGAEGTYAAVAAQGPAASVPAGFVLPPELTVRLSPDLDAWEAATRIVEFVIERVRYVPDDQGPQDAVSVLSRRLGRCSGIANAGAALLLAAGFEARTVSGLLVTGAGAVPHRWLECRLPGAGWVGCDPTLGLWVVTPSHVVFSGPVATLPEVRVVGTAAQADLAALPRRDGLPLRPNLGGELVCRLRDPGGRARARLVGPAGEWRRFLMAPEGRVTGLLAGIWRLEVEQDGVVVDRAELRLESGVVHTFLVGPPVSAAAGPRPSD